MIVYKDFLLEFKMKDSWVTMMAFVVMVIFLFAFALGADWRRLNALFPGIIWMAYLFAGILGVGRTYGHEMPEEALTGLMLAPGERTWIIAAKMFVAFCFMFGMELVASPLFFILLNQPWSGQWTPYLVTLALGAWGFVGVGTLLSALSANVRGGEALLPVLMAPLAVPVIITAVEATKAILASPHQNPWGWLEGLLAYDVIFSALPLLLYEYLWEV